MTEQLIRDPDTGRFVEGNPGKPFGRTPVTNLLASMVTAEREGKMSELEAMARKLYHLATYENDLQAIRYIVDRLDGVPRRAILVTDPTELETLDDFDEAPPRELWDRVKEIYLQEKSDEES